jgi:hypothetical protein
METLFSLLVLGLGLALAFANKAKKWVTLISIWLCVPTGFLLSTLLGFYVAKVGGCQPSARGPIECIVGGFDVSGWINGLVFSGYAFAFFVLPWFAVGAVLVAGYGIFRAFKTWPK